MIRNKDSCKENYDYIEHLDGDENFIPFFTQRNIRLVSNEEDLISIIFDISGYWGGAHGFSYIDTVNYSPELGREIEIEDDVFVGANVTFTNDLYPRSKNLNWKLLKTRICKGASIGAGSTILPGIEIGENAMIGAGSVITKNVPAGEVWVGNPARFMKRIEEL